MHHHSPCRATPTAICSALYGLLHYHAHPRDDVVRDGPVVEENPAPKQPLTEEEVEAEERVQAKDATALYSASESTMKLPRVRVATPLTSCNASHFLHISLSLSRACPVTLPPRQRTQPKALVGITLRPYQEQGLAWMLSRENQSATSSAAAASGVDALLDTANASTSKVSPIQESCQHSCKV